MNVNTEYEKKLYCWRGRSHAWVIQYPSLMIPWGRTDHSGLQREVRSTKQNFILTLCITNETKHLYSNSVHNNTSCQSISKQNLIHLAPIFFLKKIDGFKSNFTAQHSEHIPTGDWNHQIAKKNTTVNDTESNQEIQNNCQVAFPDLISNEVILVTRSQLKRV